MAFLSKYNTARHIYIPIIKRGVVDFAVSADWTPSAGDVKISKDGGAAANVTNLPTAITMGNAAMWDFSLTATEMQAALVQVTVADATTKAVEDTMFRHRDIRQRLGAAPVRSCHCDTERERHAVWWQQRYVRQRAAGSEHDAYCRLGGIGIECANRRERRSGGGYRLGFGRDYGGINCGRRDHGGQDC
jgi:hypothetical protein